MLDNSVDCLESAIDVALCGDSATASKLVDCASAAVDYLSAIAEGVAVGTKNSIEGLCNTVLHPLETVQGLGRLVGSIARAIPDYIPPEAPDPDASVEELKQYEQRLEVVRANWSNAYAETRKWWDETPTREKIKRGSQLCTEWVLFDRCMSLLHKAGKAALLEVQSGKVGLGLNKLELARAAPGYMLLHECETTASLMNAGMQYGFSVEQVEHAIMVLETQVGGCRHKLNEMMIKLEHVEGVEKNIDMIMRGNKGNVKGFYFELEVASSLMIRGEKVEALGRKFKANGLLREFDIVTENKLIECKSWNWDYRINSEEELIRTIKDFRERNQCAKEIGKEFVLISKQKIPNQFKDWLVKEKINFIEN